MKTLSVFQIITQAARLGVWALRISNDGSIPYGNSQVHLSTGSGMMYLRLSHGIVCSVMGICRTESVNRLQVPQRSRCEVQRSGYRRLRRQCCKPLGAISLLPYDIRLIGYHECYLAMSQSPETSKDPSTTYTKLLACVPLMSVPCKLQFLLFTYPLKHDQS